MKCKLFLILILIIFNSYIYSATCPTSIGQNNIGVDWSGCDLSTFTIPDGATFSGKFVKTNFSGQAGADGMGVKNLNFSGADLTDANFNSSILINPQFNNAILDETIFTYAVISNTTFGKNLNTKQFDNATLDKVTLNGVNVSNISFANASILDISGNNSNLTISNSTVPGLAANELTGGTLNITQSNVNDSLFAGMQISNFILDNSFAIGAHFDNLQNESNTFNLAKLQAGHFSNANLNNTTAKNSFMFGAHFDGANVAGVQEGSYISFVGADLTKATGDLATMEPYYTQGLQMLVNVETLLSEINSAVQENGNNVGLKKLPVAIALLNANLFGVIQPEKASQYELNDSQIAIIKKGLFSGKTFNQMCPNAALGSFCTIAPYLDQPLIDPTQTISCSMFGNPTVCDQLTKYYANFKDIPSKIQQIQGFVKQHAQIAAEIGSDYSVFLEPYKNYILGKK